MAGGVTGLILAGGESRRMGRDKAFLPWGRTTLIEHLLERLRPVTDELIVAVNPARSRTGGAKDAQAFRRLQASVVVDCVPDAHALGGLYTGLRAASHALCFVCACDTPFLDPGLVRVLARQADGYDLVIPATGEGLQPLQAVYRKTVLPAVEELLRAGRREVRALLPMVRARIVDFRSFAPLEPQALGFFNVNTPEGYATARRLAGFRR
jgi:molybdopterin-guanine dinucleotide biosynthesis protein A